MGPEAPRSSPFYQFDVPERIQIDLSTTVVSNLGHSHDWSRQNIQKLTLLPINRLAAKQTIALRHVLNVTFSLFQMAAGVTGPLGHLVPSLAMATWATQVLKQGKSMDFTSKEFF